MFAKYIFIYTSISSGGMSANTKYILERIIHVITANLHVD